MPLLGPSTEQNDLPANDASTPAGSVWVPIEHAAHSNGNTLWEQNSVTGEIRRQTGSSFKLTIHPPERPA